MSNSAWPSCPNADWLFAKAILIYGPLPASGFQLTRNVRGEVTYVVMRGPEARQFSMDVQSLFRAEIKRMYAVRGWSPGHIARVAQMWKNEFFVWLWKEIDAAKFDNALL